MKVNLKVVIIVMIFLIHLKYTSTCEHIPVDDYIEALNRETLINVRKALYEDILQLVKQDAFIKQYGKSNIRPELTTAFYQFYVSNASVIKGFIDSLSLEDLLEKSNNDPYKFHKLVHEEFVKKIIEKEQEFEKEVGSLLEIKFCKKKALIALAVITYICVTISNYFA